jgi:hypothetical protein
MANLGYVSGSGDNSYVACIIAPTPELGQTQNDFRSPLLRVLNFTDTLPSGGVELNVPTGATQLVASLRDAAGMVPPGVTVTVTTPNGTVLNQATEPNASGQVVLMSNGSLTDLVVANPATGKWTIQVEAPTTSDEFQFFISTIPTADAESIISTTLESMLHPDAKTILGPEFAESWSCTLCKWGCYVLAGTIAILVILGLTYISVQAAPIAALAGFLGVTAEVAKGLLIGVVPILVGFGTDKVAEYICSWANVCSEPSTSPAGPSWSGHQQVPRSTMSDSPSAVVFNNQLYCLYQWNDDPNLMFNVLSADGVTWATQQSVPNVQMTDGPSAVVFNGQLYCFYQGYGSNLGKLQFTVLSADGTTWSTVQQVTGASISDGPSAVVFNGKLYCFHQGAGGNGQLWYNILSADGSSWSNQQVANTTMSAGPAAVVFNGKLYCFHQGTGYNGQLRYNVLSADGTTWAGDQQVPSTTMSADPAAVVFMNRLYCFYQGASENGQLHYNVLAPDGTTWSGDRQISGATMSHGPSAVVFESGVFSGRIYCFHQGQNSNSQLWYDFT